MGKGQLWLDAWTSDLKGGIPLLGNLWIFRAYIGNIHGVRGGYVVVVLGEHLKIWRDIEVRKEMIQIIPKVLSGIF